MTIFRETIEQLCIEHGTPFHPTEEIIQQAWQISERDRVHRENSGLEPREDFPFKEDYVYDLECYPNFFSCSIIHAYTFRRWRFEISEFVNQGREFYQLLVALMQRKARMVGFNNLHYDYVLIHHFMQAQGFMNYQQLYAVSQGIFADKTGREFHIWENDHFIKQVDLLKIHHFDNNAKRTSLKMLEFNMRSENIKDLPYAPETSLTREQADNVLVYNDHDTDETLKFYIHSLPMIEFREKLSKKYNKNFTNFNDTKIGKEYFLMELHKNGIKTKNGRDLIQSRRISVALADVLLPYLHFERPEFNEVLNFFRGSVIDKLDKNGMLELKGFFKNVSATLDGFQFDFGAGGIHGSLHKTIVRESDTHLLIDIDVASYYPNLAIANKFFIEHLTELFCKIYLDVYDMRKMYDKGTPENAMLKLALNGVYGSSNDQFSPFLDPKYTLSITVNGQLLLCMLAEQLMKVPNLKMVQINTDGLTFLCPREYEQHAMNLKSWWEQLTKLELERADYTMMAIRDVNSYLAVTTEGKVKRIGAYAYELALDNPSTRELAWHKNQGAVVVAKAAEAALVRGTPIPEFIHNHDDEFDFMLRTKVPRESKLVMREDVTWCGQKVMHRDTQLQNISRYYVSTEGGRLIKVMPPTPAQIRDWKIGDHYQHETTGDYKVVKKGKKPPSGKYKLVADPRPEPHDRNIGIEAGWLVTDCSNMDDYNPQTLNYDYYIQEARKLVDELLL